MILKLKPVQFNFGSKWSKEIKKIIRKDSVEEALEKIRQRYHEIAEMKFEDHREIDKAQAAAEYGLDIHEADVMCRDLRWLQSTFEGDSLADLAFAIASELYPNEKWEMIDCDETEHSVVSNSQRTLVFDMKYYDKLSAAASLTLVGDDKYVPDETAIDEVNRLYNEKRQVLEEGIKKTRELLEKFKDDAPIVPLKF